MKIEKYPLGDSFGTIIELDEPGDLDTMHHLVSTELQDEISRFRDSLFIQLVYKQQPSGPSETSLHAVPGWYPVQQRDAVHGSNVWHVHQGVVIHCPYQEVEVVPTVVTTDELLCVGRKKTGIKKPTDEIGNRDAQLALQDSVEHFSSGIIQPSGHTLIIPAGVYHKKMTVPEDSSAGGVVHRRSW